MTDPIQKAIDYLQAFINVSMKNGNHEDSVDKELRSSMSVILQALQTSRPDADELTPVKWEYFNDAAYYHLWAVRPVGDKSFTNQFLFHVQSMAEAQALCGILNDRAALKSGDKGRWQEAVDALEPFSDIAGEGDEDFPDETKVTVTFGRTAYYGLTLGDLRKAQKVFSDLEAALPPTSEGV